MRRHIPSRKLVGLVAATVVACLAIGFAISYHAHERDRYVLHTDRIDTWKPYGGIWDINDGVFHNNSAERGAKLVSVPGVWGDISFQSDVQVDNASGDAGLIVRSADEDVGVDAYNGYYAGLRSREGTLFVGRSGYGWSEAPSVAVPGGVHPGVWFRLQVVMVGCRLAVRAENLTTHQGASLAIAEEQRCLPAGHVGLRSLATGGRWKNLSVAKGTGALLTDINKQAIGEEQLEPLTTEAAYAKRFSSFSPLAPVLLTGKGDTPRQTSIHIGDLTDLGDDRPKRVLLRGVVTSTAPDLYVEDSTGGVIVRDPQGPPVNIGDGVEITGTVHALLYSAMIMRGSVRLISTGSPAPPLAVTPWQAASGAYDARFIEIEGHLTRDVYSDHGYQVLDFTEGGETFRALYPDRSGLVLRGLRKDSLLRLRGVCVLGKTYTQDLIPFLIFLRSEDDVHVLQGPPWWTPWHIGIVCFAALGIVFYAQWIYFRFKQWKAHAISKERERIAHDIHDTMAQSFAGVGYQIQGLRTSIVRNSALTREQIAEQLTATSELVSQCHSEASRTIELLGASPHETGDLLGTLVENTYKLSGGAIRAFSEEQGKVRSLSTRQRNVLLHVGVEAISNAVIHGSPSTISFTLRYESQAAEFMIVDDGSGFDSAAEQVGYGILGMRSRAREIGGVLEVLSALGVGTRVCLSFPLSRFWFFSRFMHRNLIHHDAERLAPKGAVGGASPVRE
jgi:two-component sensor histidine kinase